MQIQFCICTGLSGTEQLTKCCEPLQKQRVRLGSFKIDLSPSPVVYIYTDTSVVVLIVQCQGVEFMFLLHLMHVFLYIQLSTRNGGVIYLIIAAYSALC